MPRGLVGHAELCHQLILQASAFIDHEQIHRSKSQIELDVCPVKCCATGYDHTDLTSAAVQIDKSVQEAQPIEQLAAALF